MKSLKRFLANTALATISTVVLLLLLEVGIRLFAPQPIDFYRFVYTKDGARMVVGAPLHRKEAGYVGGPFVPNREYKAGNFTVKINSLGWRDREHKIGKRKGVIRIAAVGDSVTFGTGVDIEDTYFRVLERLFDDHFRGSPDYETLSFAGGAGNTYFAKQVIERTVPFYKIDTAVLAFNLNDIQPRRFVKEAAGELKSEGKAPWKIRRTLDRMFRTRSHLYFLFRERVKALLRPYGIVNPSMNFEAAFDMRSERAQRAWKDTSTALEEIATFLRGRGVRFILLILPYDMQTGPEVAREYRQRYNLRFDPSLEAGEPQKIIRAFAEECGIEVIDPLDDFRKNPEQPKFIRTLGPSIDWNHLNARGHEMVAQAIYRYLVKDGA